MKTTLSVMAVRAMSPQQMVRQFHETFGHPIATKPGMISKERLLERLDYIRSEVNELEDAIEAKDLIEIADALGDAMYFVLGTFVELGVNSQKIMAEIHMSNMTKLWSHDEVNNCDDYLMDAYELTPADVQFKPTDLGVVCLRRSDNKVLKSPSFVPPDLKELVGL